MRQLDNRNGGSIKRPPYELNALREGVICAQHNIDALLGIITTENRILIESSIKKEQDRIIEFEGLIKRHLEYQKVIREA